MKTVPCSVCNSIDKPERFCSGSASNLVCMRCGNSGPQVTSLIDVSEEDYIDVLIYEWNKQETKKKK